MGRGLMCYLVPERDISTIIGCQDEVLLANILEQMAEDIDRLDQEFFTADGEHGPGLTFTQALRELISGNLSQPETCDYIYTYAFEEVCRYYGTWLSNTQFARCNSKWLDELDARFLRASIPLRFHDLVYRCPVEKLPYRNVLRLGYWNQAESMVAVSYFQPLLTTIHDSLDRLAMEEACEWLVACCEQPGSIIVGVFC